MLWTGWSNTRFDSAVKAGKLEETVVWFSRTAVVHSAALLERFMTKVIFALLLVQVRGWRSKTREHWSRKLAHAPASP